MGLFKSTVYKLEQQLNANDLFQNSMIADPLPKQASQLGKQNLNPKALKPTIIASVAQDTALLGIYS
jgi:hypothetical protein